MEYLARINKNFLETIMITTDGYTGLNFEIKKESVSDYLNLEEEICKFTTLENRYIKGCIHMGISDNDMNQFREKAIENHRLSGSRAEKVTKESLLNEFSFRFYEIDDKERLNITSNIYTTEKGEKVPHKCVYLELHNEEFDITFKFKYNFLVTKEGEELIEKEKKEEQKRQEQRKVLKETEEKMVFKYTEEELLNRIEEEYEEFLPFFKYHIKDLKKIYKNGDERYFVVYTKHDGLQREYANSLEEAYFRLYYIFDSYESFDSIWLDKENEEVFTFGMTNPYRFEEWSNEYEEVLE